MLCDRCDKDLNLSPPNVLATADRKEFIAMITQQVAQSFEAAVSISSPRTLTYVEENSIRYTSNYVISCRNRGRSGRGGGVQGVENPQIILAAVAMNRGGQCLDVSDSHESRSIDAILLIEFSAAIAHRSLHGFGAHNHRTTPANTYLVHPYIQGHCGGLHPLAIGPP